MKKVYTFKDHPPVEVEIINQAPFRKKYGRYFQASRKRYEIIYASSVTCQQQIAGLCASSEHKIFIDVTNDLESTLLHECFHAEICEGGYRQRPDWDRGFEEQLVETLAESLTHNFQIRSKK